MIYSRRLLLALPFTTTPLKKTNNNIDSSSTIPQNKNIEFISDNKKMLVLRQYVDYGDCVLMKSRITWIDPISKKEIVRANNELFILEKDAL